MATLSPLTRVAHLHGVANRVPLFSNETLSFCTPRKQGLPIISLERASMWKPSAMAQPATPAKLDYEQPSSEESKTEETNLFNWNSQWYPVESIFHLDKRVPTAVTIMGRDLVVWWDRNGQSWQVWEDKCPHRLAPLSEGRINEKGELQCSYHGWCFAPCSGSCSRIPQAPLDGAPVWKSERARASVYPCVEQEGLLWFWPDTRPEFRGIAARKPPPSIPELADPIFKDDTLYSRNMPYGYEQMIENLMDPAHVPFAHHGLLGFRETARPLNYKVNKVEKSGFKGDGELGPVTFTAPCILTLDSQFNSPKNNGSTTGNPPKRSVLLFICIPISPGQSKVIWSFRRNFSVWFSPVIPRWFLHLQEILVLDSDLYLLHMAERKLADAGDIAWEKACYAPTTSDAFVIAFRKWLRKYAGGEPNWGGRYAGLPPTPPKEQLMDRYLSHVKSCRHCKAAMQFLKGAGVFLQALSVALAAVLGAAAMIPIPQLQSWSIPLVVVAIASSVGSRWLSHLVYKTYHFHDYNHAFVK